MDLQRQVCACVRARLALTPSFFIALWCESARARVEARTMYVYAGVALGYLVVCFFLCFFSQMNILLLPDASVNREAV